MQNKKNSCPGSKYAIKSSGGPVNPSEFRTEKSHKDWYKPNTMAKQRGKPKYARQDRKK